jgi:hypothetical protein
MNPITSFFSSIDHGGIVQRESEDVTLNDKQGTKSGLKIPGLKIRLSKGSSPARDYSLHVLHHWKIVPPQIGDAETLTCTECGDIHMGSEEV